MSSAPAGSARGVPEVGRPRPMRVPAVAERTLPNGVRVVVARRPGIPRFELRLRVPTVRNGRTGDNARQSLLADTLLSGTPDRTSVALAEALQHLGGGLTAAADPESVIVSGSALSTALRPFVGLLGEVVSGASYPAEEVAVQRERLTQDIRMARSQPDTIARDALVERLWGSHPYGRGTPEPDAVAAVTAASLRRAHGSWLLPAGSILVVVGDCSPARAFDAVEAALAGWAGQPRPGGRLAPPPPPPGSTLAVDRPGAVQTNIRLAGPAVPRGHPDFPALVLANAVYGGYFTSRLVDNIRERRGYTYSPGSSLEHRQVASVFTVSADVGTEVTAAALVEIRYELGRMVSSPVEQSELDAARRYLLGTLAMSLQTQAGLASWLATLASQGLDPSYLRTYPAALARVTVPEVTAAATAYLAPRRLVTVLVGDVSRFLPALEALEAVEVRPAKTA